MGRLKNKHFKQKIDKVRKQINEIKRWSKIFLTLAISKDIAIRY